MAYGAYLELLQLTERSLEQMVADVDAEEEAARRDTVAAIKQYQVERSNEVTAKTAKELAGSLLREFFRTHPEETELVDGEWGLRAYMETRRLPGHKYDLAAIIENNPALFDRLVSVRALQVDHDIAVKQGLESEIKRYKLPSGETQALQVKEVKR